MPRNERRTPSPQFISILKDAGLEEWLKPGSDYSSEPRYGPFYQHRYLLYANDCVSILRTLARSVDFSGYNTREPERTALIGRSSRPFLEAVCPSITLLSSPSSPSTSTSTGRSSVDSMQKIDGDLAGVPGGLSDLRSVDIGLTMLPKRTQHVSSQHLQSLQPTSTIRPFDLRIQHGIAGGFAPPNPSAVHNFHLDSDAPTITLFSMVRPDGTPFLQPYPQKFIYVGFNDTPALVQELESLFKGLPTEGGGDFYERDVGVMYQSESLRWMNTMDTAPQGCNVDWIERDVKPSAEQKKHFERAIEIVDILEKRGKLE
ncbi:unnamed protein product [Peniophora sp. CBMAI 1063]|nr:unnamed protein product [Peniophora sp. CBMAI 1063]